VNSETPFGVSEDNQIKRRRNKMRKPSKAQQNYMIAKANHEAVCQIEKECKTKVLTENVFFVSEEWEERGSRITDPIIDYLMNDADSDKYFRLCYEEYLKNGIAAEDYLTCPTYKPFQALLKAEKELIDWSYKGLRKLPQWGRYAAVLEPFKDKLDYHLDIKKQVIDLAMRLSA
jgi:hypothetical protein